MISSIEDELLQTNFFIAGFRYTKYLVKASHGFTEKQHREIRNTII